MYNMLNVSRVLATLLLLVTASFFFTPDARADEPLEGTYVVLDLDELGVSTDVTKLKVELDDGVELLVHSVDLKPDDLTVVCRVDGLLLPGELTTHLTSSVNGLVLPGELTTHLTPGVMGKVGGIISWGLSDEEWWPPTGITDGNVNYNGGWWSEDEFPDGFTCISF
jgi:hypothetical protein